MLAQDHWEFLYARSIGCIGLLKLHLNRALNLALTQEAKTITEAHLRQTAMPDVRVRLAMRNALESEAEFVEAENADEQLLAELRQPPAPVSTPAQQTPAQNKQAPSTAKKRKPGKRAEGRDPTATGPDGRALHSSVDEEQKAG